MKVAQLVVLLSYALAGMASGIQDINLNNKPDPTTNVPKLKVLASMTFGSRSHIKNVFEIGNELQKRGHEMAYMTIAPYLKFSDGYNFTKFLVGPSDLKADDHRGISDLNQHRVNPLADTIQALINSAPMIYRMTMQDMLDLIDDYKPDAIYCDFFSVSCIDAAYYKHIPLMVGFQTLDGPFIPPPYITGTYDLFPTTVKGLSFLDRFYAMVIHPFYVLPPFLKLNSLMNIERNPYNIPHTFGVNVGNWGNSLKLCNTFMGFEAARPLDPTFKVIGPILSEDHALLTPELSQFLSQNQRVLYVAFGSGVQLSDNDVDIIFGAVKRLLRYHKVDAVVWALGKTRASAFNQTSITIDYDGISLNGEELLNKAHPQIRFINWAPQVSILKHKSTQLFLSHGGLESLFESLDAGTPIMTMPFFGDQYRNAKKVSEMQWGDFTDRFTHTSQSIYAKMVGILTTNNEAIQASVKRWQVTVKYQAKKKTDSADMIEEYILTARTCRAQPGYELKTPNCEISAMIPGLQKMNPIIALSIDVILFTLGLLALAFTPIILTLRGLFRLAWSYAASKTNKKGVVATLTDAKLKAT